MKKAALLMLSASLALVGCGPSHHNYVLLRYVTAQSAPEPAVDKNAQAQIAQAATSVNKSLQNLDAIELATHKGVSLSAPVNATAVGMAQTVSVSWHGPIAPLLKQIATASHYRLRVLGTAPSIPLLVNVNATDKTLVDVLRDATFQVAKEASVKLYSSNHVIELRYHV
jgi:defect-in-organelle-trafficking protein DotD